MSDDPADAARRTRGRRVLRVVFEVAVLIVGVALLLGVAKGFSPILPVVGSVLRALLHPVTLILGGLLFVLLRMGVIRARRRSGR